MNVGILFSDFGPYHAARIEALAQALHVNNNNLVAFRFAESSDTYGWKPANPAHVNIVTLFNRQPSSKKDAFVIATALRKAIKQYNIKAIFLPSYSPLPNLFCLFSARLTGIKTILMCDSWHGTERKAKLTSVLKHLFIRLFDAAFVAGSLQKKYVCSYGQKERNVFLGYDVVDTDYYEREAGKWISQSVRRPVGDLPSKYFLNLGRFVFKKNIGIIIKAYALLVNKYPKIDVSLVLVGEGPERENILGIAKEQGLIVRDGGADEYVSTDGPEIVIYPFQQIEHTPFFYAHSLAFILPSFFEEWGLVINEAMACGKCVIVSRNVGCAPDLVWEGKNGYLFDPDNSHELFKKMELLIEEPELADKLGAGSSDIIKDWGLGRFVQGAQGALAACLDI